MTRINVSDSANLDGTVTRGGGGGTITPLLNTTHDVNIT